MTNNVQADTISSILKSLAEIVKPGIMTAELDSACEEMVKAAGAESANKNYKPDWAPKPFPATLCTSVNDCIAHGIPTEYKLKEGDIINMDLGIIVDGKYADAAITVPVGQLENKNERLLRYAIRTLYAGIAEVKAGVNVIDIARATHTYALRMGYNTNRAFSGHRLADKMHSKPFIPAYWEIDEEWTKTFSATLNAGDIICLEPMVTQSRDQVGYPHRDGWSRLTRDGKYSAMFEHMILVTEKGHEVLTSHFDEHYLDDR